jgi:hypothetical protein
MREKRKSLQASFSGLGIAGGEGLRAAAATRRFDKKELLRTRQGLESARHVQVTDQVSAEVSVMVR